MNKETVEEAALAYWKTQVRRDTAKRGSTPFCTKDFKAGAEWQKEQFATEAIEFAEWLDKGEWPAATEQSKSYKQLYELYKQSML